MTHGPYYHVTQSEKDLCDECGCKPLPTKAHKVMTPEEYAAMPILGWHEVCRDIDNAGNVGVRFLSLTPA